jgi:hypothetical protein
MLIAEKVGAGCTAPNETTADRPMLGLIYQFFGIRALENTQTTLPSFLTRKFLKDVNAVTCWKCRPAATAVFVRFAEYSTEYRDVETFGVFQCCRNPTHVFPRRIKA